MKKSTAVTLIISGALIAGCGRQSGYYNGPYANQSITNNTYAPGYGYWHAPYHNWFPYPYNFFRRGYGYYHGGFYSDTPELSSVTSSMPMGSTYGGWRGGGGSYWHGSGWSGSSPGSGSSGHFGISRGGFGGSAHGSGGHFS